MYSLPMTLTAARTAKEKASLTSLSKRAVEDNKLQSERHLKDQETLERGIHRVRPNREPRHPTADSPALPDIVSFIAFLISTVFLKGIIIRYVRDEGDKNKSGLRM
jgi:hypothetical protein